MFAGVLDSGENEVFMEGGRLNKFMQTVESATSSLKPPAPESSQVETMEIEEDKKAAQEEPPSEERISKTQYSLPQNPASEFQQLITKISFQRMIFCSAPK